LELIAAIRFHPAKKILLIVVSEENSKDGILEVLKKRANQYLLKPFNCYQSGKF